MQLAEEQRVIVLGKRGPGTGSAVVFVSTGDEMFGRVPLLCVVLRATGYRLQSNLGWMLPRFACDSAGG
jgi:hypothetical protein